LTNTIETGNSNAIEKDNGKGKTYMTDGPCNLNDTETDVANLKHSSCLVH